AVGPDGNLYVADAGNHRIAVFSPDGEPVAAWGTFGAEGGPGAQPQFNEPWGLAVADDGSVYVADTWNHRVQRVSPQGEVMQTLGTYGTAETLDSFWGPRDVALDDQGRLYVSDTGNKRIVVFGPDGQPLTSFGGAGAALGFLDEPVGVSVGPEGRVYVADTWNQRVQVFEETSEATFEPVDEWSLEAWYGQSLNNKPYLDVSSQGRACISDPEGYRILCFDESGEFLLGWGDAGTAAGQFGLPVGVAFDGQGALWVVDNGNNRLMRFSPAFP
ncbi:MAG: NHL repeat-containing protein, partial [Anaerolineales bacterium]|nr:NHL repeat-containing protein [Anaerolineales bacterium]